MFSVWTTSRWKARYWSAPMSPLLNWASTCDCAWRKVSSFSLVAETCFCSNSCFCASKVTLPVSNFKALSICFSSRVAFIDSWLTLLRAFCKGCVSPSISIFIPLIFPAIFPPFLSKIKSAQTLSMAKNLVISRNLTSETLSQHSVFRF